MNGLLWLRRYPASITFTALIPFAFLFIVFVIGGGQYTHMALAGSLVSAAAGYGLATGNNIINWKVDYKMQDVFVASPVSSFTYMSGIALAELLFGLPAFVILAILVVIFSSNFLYGTATVIATLLLVCVADIAAWHGSSTNSRRVVPGDRICCHFCIYGRICITSKDKGGMAGKIK
jgi:ABC-2 type transport system permease protein